MSRCQVVRTVNLITIISQIVNLNSNSNSLLQLGGASTQFQLSLVGLATDSIRFVSIGLAWRGMAWIGLDCVWTVWGLSLSVRDRPVVWAWATAWRLAACRFPAPISRTAIGHVAPAAFSVAKCSANCYAFASSNQPGAYNKCQSCRGWRRHLAAVEAARERVAGAEVRIATLATPAIFNCFCGGNLSGNSNRNF